jgi:outer membrane protein assembly factor BamB
MRQSAIATVLAIASLAFLPSCGGRESAPGATATDFTIDVRGSVIGSDEAAIPDAEVTLNGRVVATDARGIFVLRDVPSSEGRNYLAVRKDGYFFGGRNLYVTGPEEISAKVRLIPRSLIGTFMANVGGELETPEGMSVQIPADAIEGGYQGEVRVYAEYLDPTSPMTLLGIPGLEALNVAGESGVLKSFGMGHVELEDMSGIGLQLAPGATAQLRMPVPEDLLGAADSSIPLWYFDEAAGIWREEGSASLEGAGYVGDVPHFTLWNCDDLFPCSTVNDFTISCGGIPVGNMPVVFKAIDSVLIGTGVTFDDGSIHTYLPCSEEFEIYAVPPGGNGQKYLLATILASDGEQAQIETVPVEGLCGPHASVTGTVVDGSGNPVTNGYMFLEFDDLRTEPVFFDSHGRFTASYFDYTPAQLATGARTVFWDLENFIRVEGPTVPFNQLLNVLSEPIVIDGSMASVEGRIYVAGTKEDFFYCLDATDGTVIWSYEAPQLATEVSPVITDNKVYFVSLSGELFCLNAFDGSVIWTRFGFVDTFSPFAEDGVLYVSSRAGRIRAIDADDGSQIWSYDTGSSGLFSAPTVVDDILYCGGSDASPSLLALDKTDGSFLWEWAAPDEVNSSPCVADGKVYLACDDQNVYALNALTGAVLWQQTVDASTSILGALTSGAGVVYAQSVRHLTALNSTNGAVLWQRSLLSGGDGMRPCLSGNRLYANSLGGPVYCLSTADGSTLWEIEAEGDPGEIADHFLVVDGVLFLNRFAEPSTLEARNAQNGLLLWTSEVEDDCVAPAIMVDQEGIVHYSTSSGMQQ